jgi:hypothetical protein
MSDRKEVVKSAGRIFYLIDRKSEIDPLSESGLIPDGKVRKVQPVPAKVESNNGSAAVHPWDNVAELPRMEQVEC